MSFFDPFFPSRPPFLRLLTMACLALAMTACDQEEGGGKSPAARPRQLLDAPADDLSRAVEAVTGGPTRAVWAHHLGTGSPDPYTSGSSHELAGIDTRDGRGVRVIRPGKKNFSRPLLTPDGEKIVFTRKQIERDKKGVKTYDLTILITDWNGSEPEEIGHGYAVDVWRDPATGRDWVYAAADVPPTHRIAFAANRLTRFPLDEPGAVETVWDATQVSPDNIQLSRDGTRACGQTPWPNGGQFVWSGKSPDFQPTMMGCWAGMAPDDSYVSWMLDGSHRHVTLQRAAAPKQPWTLGFQEISGLEKGEIYHPRWSNHPRFITLTGPYMAEKTGHNESTIGKGGLTAEVVIAKLRADLKGIEASVTLTDNDSVDAYPDVWIDGGETARLADFAQGAAQFSAAQTDWPPTGAEAFFAWKDRADENVVRSAAGERIDCALEVQGTALFDRHQEMRLEGGAFVAKAITQKQLTPHWQASAAGFTVELSLPTPPRADATGPLLQWPGWTLASTQGSATLNGTKLSDAPLSSGHYTLTVRQGQAQWFRDGTALGAATAVQRDAAIATLQAGGADVGGRLWGVAFYPAVLDLSVIQSNAAFWKPRNAEAAKPDPNRVRLRGKLVETTPPPTAEGIDPYTRAMIAQVFEVEQVLQGSYAEPRILVRRWAMMDLRLTQVPQEVGDSIELTLEPVEDHPELQNERTLDDTTAFDLQPWYDLAPPTL
ncbi:MAG: hypothetical protein KDK99_09400 [Verrucomicrobiales bacterium]|nr:hypothetical protein [Verrucomicrobiales bacterium]